MINTQTNETMKSLEIKFCEITRHFVNKGFTVKESKGLAHKVINEAADEFFAYQDLASTRP